ncbi:MAG: gliding motility-associated ABC transporter substrate-binding protein GldG [Salibacteraceae bacterium]
MVAGKKQQKKWLDLSTLAMAAVALILLNYLGTFIFERFDLTVEKRFTMNDATIDRLETLEDIVFVRVYLEGNLPTEFRELRDAVKETLDEMRAYAGENVVYEFINPSASSDEAERVKVYEDLTKDGLQYTNIRMQAGDKVSEQIIFPGAIVSYNGKEIPIQLLKSKAGATQQEMISVSIQQLEYELMSAIRKLTSTSDLRVAFIEGHGELDELETAGAERALAEFYAVERIRMDEKLDALRGIDAIIIARPDSAYSEKDKFIIDQYIMNGGKVLWFVDPVYVRMDSLRNSQFTMATVLDHNLTDQLFKYGARLNNDLIMDLEALPIPIVTGMVGNQPRQEMFTWYYHPLLLGNEGHPLSRNLDRIKTSFSSTIDALQIEGVKATPLLQSSSKARIVNAPARVSFNVLREAPQYERFNGGPYTNALLLEGVFPSVFTNRLPRKLIENENLHFKEKSIIENKMIVVADGDIIRNEVNRYDERFYALGYYKYSETIYGNEAFLLNSMNYLLDDSGLINLRNKEFKVRLLDQAKIDQNRYFWQATNTALPIIIVLLYGFLRMWIRKRKFNR